MTEIDAIHISSGNVFSDLGFAPDDAAVMLIRIEVAAAIIKRIRKNGWASTQAARELDIPERLVTQIINTDLTSMSLDTLWTIAVRSGLNIELRLLEKD
ncbi:helix-turn-helix domain-containing protein [Herbaspirillum sp. B65]|uniref:helix-turn-helix domain-containing protein n=1 Tax=Herbaspirillum sp. B65 TaxID=137708 RepID=UPI0005C986D2|nr:XRE family transcriptional regulator [Herbaspirillum sp. B65]